jgi:tRNA threonylcarbamoyladenosine biosynthesis protein TsaB
MTTRPLLAIDASTYRGTAAIVDGTTVIGEAEVRMRGADEERLMPAVAALLEQAGLRPAALGGVVCGEGPGSFTSLRIAAAIAKGIVTATGQPLLAVPSLLLMIAGAAQPLPPGRYLSLLDAMRGDWFAARVAIDAGRVTMDGEQGVLDTSGVARVLESEQRVAVGPGQAIDCSPHARGVARLGGPGGLLRAVDAATWEPSYGRLAEAQVRWEQSHGRPLVA